ncbi:MAG: hypothetical protein MHM6MM_003608 [Cercozoa sp. M6MM]
MSETFDFSADITQLMDLIIHSLYSNKEIFLRELISNASDAIDKIRFQASTDSSALATEEALKIEIVPDKESNTLTVRDTGIGMTREELIKNLGTIASSGTKQFVSAITAGADLSMIGQFGVGFYSAYLVADRVVVRSKSNNDEQYKWTSEAGGTFVVEKDEGAPLTRGTEIVLHLKEGCESFLEEDTIKNIVKQHSQFIPFPISLYVTKTEEVEDEEEAADSDDEEADEPKIEEVKDEDEDKEDKPKKTKTVTTQEFELLNKQKPIWLRNPDDVKQEEYAAFFKSLTNEWDDHAAVEHFKVEGAMEFTGLLFVPKRAPNDMFGGQRDQKQKNLKLYVRRVFITDDCAEFCPDWLSFVKGLVDSEDLPLNVSREMLQQSKVLRQIKKSVVKKSIAMFTRLAENDEEYLKFYKNFGKQLKLGIYQDEKNRDKLAELLRFQTSKSGEDQLSLKQYVANMKEEQKDIYYITGESKQAVENSPFLEALKKRGLEVLYLTDAIDEYVTQQLKEFDGHKLVSVTKEGLELPMSEEEKARAEEEKAEYDALCTKVKEILGDKVEKVVVSYRMEDSPCSLVTAEFGWSANMERIMKAQALGGNDMYQFMAPRKTLEINPKHGIVKSLKKLFAADPEDKTIKDFTFLLFETAMLTSGFTLDEPTTFASRIHKLIKIGLDVEDDEEEDVAAADADEDMPELDTEDASMLEEVD